MGRESGPSLVSFPLVHGLTVNQRSVGSLSRTLWLIFLLHFCIVCQSVACPSQHHDLRVAEVESPVHLPLGLLFLPTAPRSVGFFTSTANQVGSLQPQGCWFARPAHLVEQLGQPTWEGHGREGKNPDPHCSYQRFRSFS